MSRPRLPRPAAGEVLVVDTRYKDGRALWGGLPEAVGGRRERDFVVLGDGAVRLRLVQDVGLDYVEAGNLPGMLAPGSERSKAVVLVDIPVVYGEGAPLLVDVAQVPGRGVRVAAARLGEVLTALHDGALAFDDLVSAMDVYGLYQGDGGRAAFPAPTGIPRRAFPELPSTRASLLVRTCFDDDAGWQSLLQRLGGVDDDGWVGANLDPDEIDVEHYPLEALVVDDRAYEGLWPGQVPALVRPGEETILVALADARTFARPDRPLTVVDLYDTPGQIAVLPCSMAGSLACNLELANMDFHDFIIREGAEPWWED
ncbi:MAG: hypothetical protein FWE75_02065 [Actinomycetia bacterium]|nr:hypothetical protein [Actinomycetes bacterium]